MKKIIVLFIAGLILLTGCGKATRGDSTAIMNKKGLPIVNEPIELECAVLRMTGRTAFADMPIVQEMEKKTNVKIRWREFATDSFTEKRQLMFAAEDFPDMMWNNVEPEHVYEFGINGDSIIPLDDLIDKYAPRWKQIMEEHPIVKREITAPNGKIYGLPIVRFEESEMGYRDAMYINKTWLDKLNLKVPTTTEEFKNVLAAFKTMDPNGNGKADEIPWSFRFSEWIGGEYDMYGIFGAPTGDYKYRTIIDDKVVFMGDKPQFKEAVKYLSELYKAGVLDLDAFTQSYSQVSAKVQSVPGIVGVYQRHEQENTQDKFVAIKPITAPNGATPKFRAEKKQVMGRHFTIFKKNAYPEISMRWADEWADPDISIHAMYGPLEKNESTGYYVKKPVAEGQIGIAAPGNFGPFFITDDAFNKTFGPNYEKEARNLYQLYKDNVIKAENIFPINVILADEEKEILTDTFEKARAHTKKKVAEWIVSGNIDAEWDAYINKIYSEYKLQEGMDTLQKIYDNYKSIK